MLSLTSLHTIEWSQSWPYDTHALLIASTLEELVLALERAKVTVALEHRHLVPHAHIERNGWQRLRSLGVPLLSPTSNDRMQHHSQEQYPIA